jgi:hypothetical protein
MSDRFSDQDRQRIIREMSESIIRADGVLARSSYQPPISDEQPPERREWRLPPAESRLTRERRELDEQEARFAAERAREECEAQREAREAQAEHHSVFIERVTILEGLLFDVTRATNIIAENVSGALRDLRTENAELKTAQAKLETKLAELQIKLIEATGADKAIIDLPLLPSRRVQ